MVRLYHQTNPPLITERKQHEIAINGFGRIGRAVFRILDQNPDIEITAINDLFDPGALRYLLSYDTVMGVSKSSRT